jgi:hypothetical protein
LRVRPLRRQQPSEELFAITSPLVAQTQIGAAAPKKEVIFRQLEAGGPEEIRTPDPQIRSKRSYRDKRRHNLGGPDLKYLKRRRFSDIF